jgi:putative DNA primase/helicase
MGALHEKVNFDALRELCDDEGKFSERLLAEKYIEAGQLYSINRILYDMDGEINEAQIKNDIAKIISLFYKAGINQKVNSAYEAIITFAYVPEINPQQNEIPVKNGTILINGDSFVFTEEKKRSLYRLNCEFNQDAEEPAHFLRWVNELLHEEDIAGFQEILGYLLLPTTKAQKAFFLLGTGEEGKSIWGWVLEQLLGKAFVSCKIPELEENRFTLATIENKLVAFDDDLNHKALKTTDTFKSLVTNKIKMMGERKGVDKFEFFPFARLCACGNFALSALYDTSDAFFRRIYPIRVKNRPPNRVNIADFEQPMVNELSGILIWALQGLRRLIQNGYHFSMSERSKNLLIDMRDDADSIPLFAETELVFAEGLRVTSSELVRAYKNYCVKNGEKVRGDKTLIQYFKDREDLYKIKHSRRVKGESRGFIGMGLKTSAHLDKILGGTADE